MTIKNDNIYLTQSELDSLPYFATEQNHTESNLYLNKPTILLGEGGSINCNGFRVTNVIFKNLKVTNCGIVNTNSGLDDCSFDNCVLFNTNYLGNQTPHFISLDIMKYIKDLP